MLRLTSDYETARDLTQDVFVKAYEKLGSFNFRYRFFSWIYRLAINEAINYNRKYSGKKSNENIDSYLEKVEENVTRNLQMNKLYSEISTLKMEYRILVVLKYFCDFSYTEISEVTKVPERKVRSRLFSARELLRQGLIEKRFFEDD
jgi:RNA polymerase sigma-70 factor (ECF subfamily)